MTSELAKAAVAEADRLEEAGDLRGAASVLTAAIEREPDEAWLYARRGYVYRLGKGWRRAIADLDFALRLQPDTPTPIFWRGTCRATIGDFDGAITDFARVIELQPDSPDAHWETGVIHVHRGDLAQAIRSYRMAYMLDPVGHDGLAQEIKSLEAQLFSRGDADQARQLEKGAGKDARRNAHDAKKKGEGDRPKSTIREDYKK